MTELGRGSDAEFCSAYPTDGHHMVSRSVLGSKLIRWVEICSFCGWIDGAALDRWAEQAHKEQLTKNAQMIAVAAETEPFAFAQMPDQKLTLENVLGQALGAASMCWEHPDRAGTFDSSRAKQIYNALLAEVERFSRIGRAG